MLAGIKTGKRKSKKQARRRADDDGDHDDENPAEQRQAEAAASAASTSSTNASVADQLRQSLAAGLAPPVSISQRDRIERRPIMHDDDGKKSAAVVVLGGAADEFFSARKRSGPSTAKSEADMTVRELLAREKAAAAATSGRDEEEARNVLRRGKKKRHFKEAVDSDEEEERQLEATGMRSSGSGKKNESQQQKEAAKAQQRDRARQIARHDQRDAIAAQCWWWIESPRFDRDRLLALGNRVALVWAAPQALATAKTAHHYHLYLVPIPHAPALTACDEDAWREIRRFQASLRQMAAAREQGVLFYETVLPTRSFWQTRLEAVFVPRPVAADAPLYFQTALAEQAEEWGTHQKLLKTGRGGGDRKELRATVPANFAYFYVEFGGGADPAAGDGYVQLIESRSFPQDFGADTVRGMMRLDPLRFRSQAARSPDEERQRIRQFLDQWKPFDWTAELD